jgi:hypothetical protein
MPAGTTLSWLTYLAATPELQEKAFTAIKAVYV